MPQPSPPHRLPWLDALRGVALVAMFGYHLAWDLAFLGLIDPQFPDRPAFRLYGHAIAAGFLALAGIGLALALRRPGPWPGIWRRLALIAACAAAISLATYAVFPDEWIYFGILHCIALGSLLALPLVRAPLWTLLAAIAATLALPLLVASSALDGPAFWWLGLGTRLHQSVDVRPFVPWFGAMLAGVALARLDLLPRAALPGSLRGLAWMGRRSLAIYLLHQPVMLGALYVFATLSAAPPGFARQCGATCLQTGESPAVCARGCDCLAAALEREASPLPPGRLEQLALQCRAPGR